MNSKKGNNIVVLPIIFVTLTIFIIIISYSMINNLSVFIYYQKIDNVMNKYLFVIEKFGYLTENEKNNLLKELEQKGIDVNNVYLEYPKEKKEYGELVDFNLKYILKSKEISIDGIKIGFNEKETIIWVRKNSFSKINLCENKYNLTPYIINFNTHYNSSLLI